ncbi:hypothetical protein J6590_101172 [Homalodisca vitripennis]|nr:hypothetical protein J6590_101172 [Homalodisca vitripennis]
MNTSNLDGSSYLGDKSFLRTRCDVFGAFVQLVLRADATDVAADTPRACSVYFHYIHKLSRKTNAFSVNSNKVSCLASRSPFIVSSAALGKRTKNAIFREKTLRHQ